MSGPFGSQHWMYNASSGFYPYEINNSLKFEDGDSSYLSRTPTSAGNRKTFTWSGWLKFANLVTNYIFTSGTGGSDRTLFYYDSNQLKFLQRTGGGTQYILTATPLFRDPSSWYHLVLSVDTTQATSADRVKIYINGQEVSGYSGSYPPQNTDTYINNTTIHAFFAQGFSVSASGDGYLAEVNFIDGSALDPTSFGETKEGIWIPKDPTGLTYGTNGFRLPFTETTTANGFNTVTYTGNGATQSIEGVGFQPDMVWLKSRSATYDHVITDSVRGVSKELIPNKTNAETTQSGLDLISFDNDGFTLKLGTSTSYNNSSQTYVGWCWGGGTNDKTYTVTVVDDSGNKYRFDGHGTSSIALNLTEGATYTFNYPSAHPLRFSTTSDGTHGGGSEYTTGVTHVSDTQTTLTVASGAPVLYYYCSQHSGMGGQVNTNTTDGPTHAEGTILSRAKPNASYGFSIVSYTGTGSNATVAHGLGAEPKLIIAKRRNATANWTVGEFANSGNGKYLKLNTSDSLITASNVWNSTSPTSSVISIGTSSATNISGGTYIAYCFADVTGYQKIGTYTGTGSSGNAITGLGFRPAFLMVKCTSNTGSWVVVDNTRNPDNSDVDKALFWNLDYAEQTTSSYDFAFDADGFTINSTAGNNNGSGRTYIYLAIADTRDAAFWTDASGNGNDWTPNALQHSDVMPDTPTDGFSTYNHLATTSGFVNLSEGNLKATSTTSAWSPIGNTMHMSSGKWYWEIYVEAVGTRQIHGIVPAVRQNGRTTFTGDLYAGTYADEIGYRDSGAIYRANGGTPVATYSTYTTGDILGFALDMDNGTLDIYKNNSSAGAQFTGLSGEYLAVSCPWGTSSKSIINFGQDSSFNANEIAQGNADDNGKGDFYYAPPSGHLALCNDNLPDPAIDPNAGKAPEDYFNTVFYSGNSGTTAVTGVGFQPDWTWVKSRNTSGEAHKLVDSVRGAGKTIFPTGTSAEIDYSGVGHDSFDSDGFTVIHNASNNQWNVSGRTYVAWNWKAGTAFSNSSGTNGATIDSTGSVNADAGFSIVSYTGDNTSNNARIAHGLSSAPEMIIAKRRDSTSNFWVYHKDLNGGTDPYHYYLLLNSTAAEASRASSTNKVWGTADPDANTFGGGLFGPNGSGTKIAYCFHSVEGYSKFGSYKGNGSSNGAFVYTGFRPAFVIVKRTDTVEQWHIQDSARSSFNQVTKTLYANLSNAESDSTNQAVDFVSNGLKIKTSNSGLNASSGTYIYMAFAEQPFKYSNAR
jgi:hypothetical protein